MNDLAHHAIGFAQEHPVWTTVWFSMFCAALSCKPFCLAVVRVRNVRVTGAEREREPSNESE